MNSAMGGNSIQGLAFMYHQPNDAPESAGSDDYEQLPEPIKLSYTRAEYLWLSDAEKATLVQQECEPEW